MSMLSDWISDKPPEEVSPEVRALRNERSLLQARLASQYRELLALEEDLALKKQECIQTSEKISALDNSLFYHECQSIRQSETQEKL